MNISENILKIALIEGTYGTGRTHAINNTFSENRQKDIRVVRASGDPFRASDDVCLMWKELLQRCIEKAVGDMEIHVSEEATKEEGGKQEDLNFHKTSEIIEKSLIAAENILVNTVKPKNQSKMTYIREYVDRKRLYRLNDLIGTKYNSPAEQSKANRLTLRKDEMEYRRVLDHKRKTQHIAVFENQITDDDSQLVENEGVIRLISAIIAGLSKIDKRRLVLIIEDSQYMDPFSWLILNEIAERWTTANLTIVLSHRRLLVAENDLKLEDEKIEAQVSSQAKRQFIKNFDFIYARETTQATFRTLRSTSVAKANEPAEDYTIIDQVRDIELLHEKVRNFNCTEFIEVRARPEHTEDIMCNILKVSRIPPEAKVLVRFLKEKTRGNPLYINDALKEYKEAKVLRVSESFVDGRIMNELFFERDVFLEKADRNELTVPTSVENRCGMILDQLSIVGQIALKIASIIPSPAGSEEFKQIRKSIIRGIVEMINDELGEAGGDESLSRLHSEEFHSKVKHALKDITRRQTFIDKPIHYISARILERAKDKLQAQNFDRKLLSRAIYDLESIIEDCVEVSGSSSSFCLKDFDKLFPDEVKGFKQGLEEEWQNLIKFGIIEIDFDYYEKRRKQTMIPPNKRKTNLSEEHLGDDKSSYFYKFQNEWMRESLENRILYRQKSVILSKMLQEKFKPLSASFDVSPIYS